MWQSRRRGGRAGPWLPGLASLRVRLLATALCLLAAGAVVITGVGSLLAKGYLMGQADQQLRGYTGRLLSHPFVATPILRVAPGAGELGTALGIEVRGSAGQLVLRQGGGAQTGQVIPAVSATAAGRAGDLVTVAASGGNRWRVIAAPIHYQVRRIPFGYDAEDFSVVVTSPARPGLAGTLVAELELRSIGQATGKLAVTGLAVSGIVAVLITCLGAVALRVILRPVSRARQTLAAAAAGELSHRVPQRHAGGEAGRLASSLNAMLAQLEQAFRARARTEATARKSTGRTCQLLADTGHEMRKPLSVIHGLARSWHRGGQPGASEQDRALGRIAGEAARLDALVGDLPTRHDPAQH
ncbi:MAG TPA: HAMP domain-containing protein [Streptosporangiaceae bacterium]